MDVKITIPELTPAEKAERVMKVDVLLFDPSPRLLVLADESEFEPSAEEKAQAEAFFRNSVDANCFYQMTPEEVMADFDRGIALAFGIPLVKLR